MGGVAFFVKRDRFTLGAAVAPTPSRSIVTIAVTDGGVWATFPSVYVVTGGKMCEESVSVLAALGAGLEAKGGSCLVGGDW